MYEDILWFFYCLIILKLAINYLLGDKPKSRGTSSAPISRAFLGVSWGIFQEPFLDAYLHT